MPRTIPADRFPDDFLWGCATSAYQIEGSTLADGAGMNVWQRFCHTHGRVVNDENGDIACDHYRRWESDIKLMQQIGMQAYRFSIAWARILPEGTGRVNAAGIGFYDRLVDRLLAREIQPVATLFHWDLPAALDDRGGWLNRDIASWFAEYADILFRRFDDRIRSWSTLNEPWVVSDNGYLHGTAAPGHRNKYEAPIATHNLMRAHGAAIQAYRASGRNQIGLVVNIEPKYPASQSPEDIAATRRAEAQMNRQFIEPALLGNYPEEMREIFGDAWPDWPDDDFKLIRQPIDFVGLNYYTRAVVRHEPTVWPLRAAPVRQIQHAHTEMGWEVFPQGLTDTLVWLKDRYGSPVIYITENGAAFADPPRPTGTTLNDPPRVNYFRSHIRAVHEAMRQGVDVRGYFAWSLFDNFEWALGYSKRFGIVHVDYETQRRTPKASAKFFSEVIASNGAVVL